MALARSLRAIILGLRPKVPLFQSLNTGPALTVADQALVSGCNFLSGILLVRTLGLEDYGHFVLLYAALQYLNTFGGALIISPMMSLAPVIADERSRRRLLRGAFGWQFLLSLLLGSIALLAGKAWQSAVGDWPGAEAILPFALAVLAFQLQDWFRRYHFVRQQPVRAFRADILAYGGMLVAMCLAGLTNQLDVSLAFAIISITFAVATLVDFFVERVLPTRMALREAYRHGRHAARDYLLAWQLTWAANQGILFIGAAAIGAEGAGAVRATQILLGPLNVAFQALDNLLPVRAGIAYRSSGMSGLNTNLRATFFQLAGPLMAVMLMLGVFAKPLMGALYGTAFEAFASLIIWQCLQFSLQYGLRFLQVFHRTLNDTAIIVQSSLLSAVTAFLTAVAIVPQWREAGVVASWCLASTVSIVFLGWRAQRILMKDRS